MLNPVAIVFKKTHRVQASTLGTNYRSARYVRSNSVAARSRQFRWRPSRGWLSSGRPRRV